MLQIYKNNEIELPKERYVIQYCEETLNDHYHGSNNPSYGRYGDLNEWGEFNQTKQVHRIRILLPYELKEQEDFYIVRYNKNIHNIDYPDHIELIQLTTIYDQSNDFALIDNKLMYTISSRMPQKGITKLYVVKHTSTQIKMKNILSINDSGYQPDTETSWNLRIQNGHILTSANQIGEDQKWYNIGLTSSGNPLDTSRFQIMSYIKPKIYAGNILGIDQAPIHIDEELYTYPDYDITVFPVTTDSN